MVGYGKEIEMQNLTFKNTSHLRLTSEDALEFNFHAGHCLCRRWDTVVKPIGF